ncbi:MAG: helix-turn-helix domain-containing protein [Planctomycetota bacterium]
MEPRKARRVHRELTPEEQRRWQRAREEAEDEKEEILAEGRRIKSAQSRIRVAVRDALKLLKAERQAMGLSLADIEQKSGIGRAALSRLENEREPNPTVLTLTRYAEALGKQLVVGFK